MKSQNTQERKLKVNLKFFGQTVFNTHKIGIYFIKFKSVILIFNKVHILNSYKI